MSDAFRYEDLFTRWPTGLHKRGIVTTTLNEAIPFKSFMQIDGMLLLDRTNPDSLGARLIFLEYSSIAAVKLIDPVKSSTFTDLGFTGQLSQ